MMKAAVIGSLVSAGLLILAAGGFSESREAFAQRHVGQEPSAGSDLIAFTTAAGDSQQITIIDPTRRVMTVYHVDGEGRIALKSARQIDWDLKLMQLNSAAPLPQEVRSMVQP
jgi:hypothetical protein